MAIEITGLPTSKLHNADDGAKVDVARSEPTSAQLETGRPSTGDTVSLTDTASQLRKLENSLASLPVVDAQRVERVKQAIADGNFQIDPVQVADKMLSFERALSV